MIQLTIKTPTQTSQDHLSQKQTAINSKATFEERAETAAQLWENKMGAIAGVMAFEDIKAKLVEMCVSVNTCNYCENNEATDIEHIYPKKLFPELAFEWENYLRACACCNTTWKADKFAILCPAGSHLLQEIPQTRGAYIQPDNNDGALVHPRRENPLAFLLLDVKGKTFHFSPKPGITLRDEVRARYTLKLLGLNERDQLVEARRSAANYYLDRLAKYIKVIQASSVAELDIVTSDMDNLSITYSFEDLKLNIQKSIVNDIRHYPHPTVWEELKRQKDELIKTNLLFQRAPEALTW